MAKLNQITVETLRHYEKLGLITPDFVDEETNYRYYTIEQSAKLDMIIRMKNLGMPLSLIKKVFEKEDIKFVQSILNQRLNYFNEKISELMQIKYTVEKSINNFSAYERAPKSPDITIEHIPARKILTYSGRVDFYHNPVSEFEYAIRDFKKWAISNHLQITSFCNVGDLVHRKTLEQNEFICNDVFIFIDDSFKTISQVDELPESDYVCMYFEDKKRKLEYSRNMLQFINENGYRINGDYICEIIADLPCFKKNDRMLYMKAQIPVIM